VVVVEVDTTEPGRDEVVVRIHTCGVCHSDLHLVKQDWSFAPPSGPIGHEAIGVVERLGPGAERFVAVGDRVILGLGGAGGGFWCGSCEFCVDGHPRLCTQAKQVLGAMAETYTIWAPALVVLPEAVDDLEAPLACGGLTAYSAVRKLTTHDIGPGSVVAVLGAAGGLGHYAVQLAAAFGHRVLAVDVGAERLAFARELGAEWAVEPGDAAATAADVGGAHASLVFAASIAGYRLGFELLRKRGLFIGVGLPAPTRVRSRWVRSSCSPRIRRSCSRRWEPCRRCANWSTSRPAVWCAVTSDARALSTRRAWCSTNWPPAPTSVGP